MAAHCMACSGSFPRKQLSSPCSTSLPSGFLAMRVACIWGTNVYSITVTQPCYQEIDRFFHLFLVRIVLQAFISTWSDTCTLSSIALYFTVSSSNGAWCNWQHEEHEHRWTWFSYFISFSQELVTKLKTAVGMMRLSRWADLVRTPLLNSPKLFTKSPLLSYSFALFGLGGMHAC
jgi:hypothetical protein